MNAAAAPSWPRLSDRFVMAVEMVCLALLAVVPKQAPILPWVRRDWERVDRLRHRLLHLVLAIKAGEYETMLLHLDFTRRPRPASARTAEAARPTRAERRAYGWIRDLLPWIVLFGIEEELRALLAEPEIDTVLACSPQGARILRPLCWMIGVRPPDALRRKRRGPAEPAAPAAPTPQPRPEPPPPGPFAAMPRRRWRRLVPRPPRLWPPPEG